MIITGAILGATGNLRVLFGMFLFPAALFLLMIITDVWTEYAQGVHIVPGWRDKVGPMLFCLGIFALGMFLTS